MASRKKTTTDYFKGYKPPTLVALYPGITLEYRDSEDAYIAIAGDFEHHLMIREAEAKILRKALDVAFPVKK